MSELDSQRGAIRQEILRLVERYTELAGNDLFIPGETTVHPSGKLFDHRELQAGIESILDGWWTEGSFAKKFESQLRKFVGSNRVQLVNSGSSANLLAFYALTQHDLGDQQIRAGDEVISVATAFPTTVAPIIQAGAVPVFVDIMSIESGQYNIDCSQIGKALSPKTRAIFLAHTLGNPFDLEKITSFARENNLWLIEDCCDALGSKYRGQNVGSFGDISTLSFYPAHHITSGEGGATLTNNARLDRIIGSLRSWGRDCWCDPGVDNTCGKRYGWQIGNLPFGYDHKNIYTRAGFNLKMTDMQAAIASAQMEKIEEFRRKREENFKYLHSEISRYESDLILPAHLPNADPSWFGFPLSVRASSRFTRENIVDYLTKNRVMSRALFAGNITRQPLLNGVNYRVIGSLNNSDAAMDKTFWIGVQPNITEEKREYVTRTLKIFFDNQ